MKLHLTESISDGHHVIEINLRPSYHCFHLKVERKFAGFTRDKATVNVKPGTETREFPLHEFLRHVSQGTAVMAFLLTQTDTKQALRNIRAGTTLGAPECTCEILEHRTLCTDTRKPVLPQPSAIETLLTGLGGSAEPLPPLQRSEH